MDGSQAGGNLSYISLTVQYDGDLPGLYPSLTEGPPNKAFQVPGS